MVNEKIKLGQLEIDLGELTTFIVKAKKNCYAGDGKEQVLTDGSKRLIFQEEDFFYGDNYDGYYQAPGTEIVRWQKGNGQRIWQMSYSGGMLPEFFGNRILATEVFKFLKRALSDKEAFLRGPNQFSGFCDEYGNLTYTNHLDSCSTIKRFSGQETISSDNITGGTVFSQDYIGGLVIPK